MVPELLILVGLPGSGKTTFCSQLSEFGWERVSQDVLGSRAACERKAREILVRRGRAVVDRCNFDDKQRSTWVRLAAETGARCGCVQLQVPIEECIRRVNGRVGHETLRPGPQATRVVHRMARDFRSPTREEGMNYFRIVRNQREWTVVLDQFKQSE